MSTIDTGLLSVLLRERLLGALTNALASIEEMRAHIHSGDTELLDQASVAMPELLDAEARALGAILSQEARAALETAMEDACFRNRVIQTALEEVFSERISPPIRIQTAPWSSMTTAHSSVHAAIFQHSACIGNELYPLMVDAYEHDCNTGGSRLVLGVHTDWITPNGCAARAMIFDVEHDAMIEAPLDPPLPISSAQLLAASAETRQAISKKLMSRPIVQVNPSPVCDAMDDKYACWERWRDAHVPTPPTRLLPRSSIEPTRLRQLINDVLKESDTPGQFVVMQPNHGTEGRLTKSISLEDPVLHEHASRIAEQDDVLIRFAVASLEMQHPATGEFGFFDLRLNVVDGMAESGYFLIAQPGSIVASPLQGGRIVEWRQREPLRIRSLDDAAISELDESAWRALRETAERAAAIFSDCRMAGVDVRLDRSRGEWRAWALDVNPCPAGLMHACFLDEQQPGVTRRLWTWLDAMRAARNHTINEGG